MYYEHFGLTEPPFRITPDTRLFFPGGSRGAILDAIVYAIASGEGIIKVIGEVGSGKTMICRMLEVKLPESIEVVYLANPSLSPENILHAIAFEMKLALPPGAGRLEVMHALHARLLEKHADNRQVVMFVEEAQRMPLDTLEEIRLLSNLETEREKLLQIVLFGQPELERNLSPTHIRQLKERITHGFVLPRLEAEEIRAYLDFRMRSAGYKGPPVFSAGAVKRISRASEGLIRRINVLADKALLSAYANGRHEVTRREARSAIRDSEFGGPRWTFDWRVAGLFGAAALGAGVMWFAQGGYRHVPWLAGLGEGGAPTTVASGPVVRSTSESPPPVSGQAGAAAAPVADEPRVEVAAPAIAPVPRVEVAAPAASPADITPAPRVETAAPAVTPAAITSAPRFETSTPAVVAEARVETTAPAAAPEPRPEAGAPAETPPAASPEPAPAAPARSGAGRESAYVARRLTATEEWLKTADASRYSIQLMHIGIDRGAGLEASLRHGGLGADLERVWLYRTRIGGVELLSVLLGDFSSQDEARRALQGLPAALRQAKPFVRPLREIRGGVAGVSG